MVDPLVPMLAAFVVAILGTGLMRRYALARQLLDIPNARSSHAVSTPRGGGLAIVASFVVVVAASAIGGAADPLLVAVLPAALAVAAMGFWDDHRDLPASARMAVHFVAIAWAIHWLGDQPVIPSPVGPIAGGWPARLLALLAIVWFVNLFNFMDGIDGIAAGEAVFVAFSGAWLALLAGDGDLAFALLVLGAAALGFLVWNWHPARIFMGDVGSGFLGAALGLLGYAAAIADAASLWPWVILVGVFVTDATLTLLRRFLRRERWFEPHRSHAYQRAARRWGHARVTLAVLAINAGWLLPLALWAWSVPHNGVMIAALAYLPLVSVALWFGAGIAETSER